MSRILFVFTHGSAHYTTSRSIHRYFYHYGHYSYNNICVIELSLLEHFRYPIRWTYMRMYDFNFFRYICGLKCMISLHVYDNSLFTCDIIIYLKTIKNMCF
jgi:hypothetical protein